MKKNTASINLFRAFFNALGLAFGISFIEATFFKNKKD
jgi:hypothetical protein